MLESTGLPDLTPGKPDYTTLTFPDASAGRPYIVLNMVESLDGRAVIEGTERGLGSPTDQRLMRELRVHADIVLNGAATLRASGTSPRLGDPALEDLRRSRGQSGLPFSAVISANGNLPLERPFFTANDFQAYVYLADTAPETRRAAIAATGRPVVVVPAQNAILSMLRHMHEELHARFVLVEGGPSLNGELLEADLVDEVFVTLGAVLVGGHDPLTLIAQQRAPSIEATRRLRLLAAHADAETSELFLRYRLLPRGA
jgi:riboflavin biosynthesis pyrimidine reductase